MATGIFQTVIIGGVVTLVSLLISVPLWLVYTGVIQVGGLTDNPGILGIMALAILPLMLWIAGFSAQTGVRLVR